MDRNFVSINPTGGLSIRNGSQVISVSSNGVSISSDHNPMAPGENNMNQLNSLQNDSPFNFLQPPSFPFGSMFGGFQPPNPLFNPLPTQQMSMRNNFGVVTSMFSTPTFFSQQTITTGVPSRLRDPLDLMPTERPIEEIIQNQNPFSGFFSQQIPFRGGPLSFLMGGGPVEESKQDQGLTREQISRIDTSIFERKQKGGPTRLKTKNGISKKPKNDPKVVSKPKQRALEASNRRNKRQKEDHPETHVIDSDPEIEEIRQAENKTADKQEYLKDTELNEEKSSGDDSGPTSNRTCAICLGDYKEGDELRVLPCDHKFHKECIDRWLVEKNNCPVCKKKPVENTQSRRSASRDPLTRGNTQNRNNVLFSVTVNSNNPLPYRPPSHLFDLSAMFDTPWAPQRIPQRANLNVTNPVPNADPDNIIVERAERRSNLPRTMGRKNGQDKARK